MTLKVNDIANTYLGLALESFMLAWGMETTGSSSSLSHIGQVLDFM